MTDEPGLDASKTDTTAENAKAPRRVSRPRATTSEVSGRSSAVTKAVGESTSTSEPKAIPSRRDARGNAEVTRGDVVEITQGAAELVEARQLSVSQGGVGQAHADQITVRQGGIGQARAAEITVSQGGVGLARGDRISVGFGGLGAGIARELSVSQGVAGTVVANEVHLEQTGVRTLVARTVHAGNGTGVVFLIAQRVDGSVRTLFDWRSGLAFGAAFGLLVGVLRRRR
jgi:hypothetical protein